MNKLSKRFYQFDSFRVDATERQLWQDGKHIALTPKVFDILLVLLENKGQTVEKDELIKKVWADTFVEEGSLNRNISTLRKALGDDSTEQKFIKTLPKRGYRFTTKVEEIVEEENLIEEKITQHNLSSQSPLQLLSRRNYTKIIFAIICVSILTFALIWVFSKSSKSKIDLSGLTENERQQLAKNSSANIPAYEDYVKGRILWHQRSAEGLHQSIIHLESAVKNDANFALAHSALADAYAFDAVKWKEAERHAQEAIKLNPNLGEPHATIGFVRMFWEWKLPEAKESLRKAVELSPDYATAHQWYAISLIITSVGGASLAEMKRAAELEPKSLAINADLCQVLYFLRKYDDALTQCSKTLEMDANFLNAHIYLYEIYTAKEMYNEAVEKFFKIEQLKSDFSLPFAHLQKLRTAFKQGGIRAFWQTRVEYLEQNQHSYQLAQYYTRLGNKEKALSWLRKSYENRDFDFIFFRADPAFYDLRNEPQFLEFVQKFAQ
ncbi:MAG TPA: winged helix-turn-helix domain-containing protein [Pyrinomonadaceae bacterium]|nr:winged helix-turn-helix domain-containing protein [Pyrinomonadaceae bacterium]